MSRTHAAFAVVAFATAKLEGNDLFGLLHRLNDLCGDPRTRYVGTADGYFITVGHQQDIRKRNLLALLAVEQFHFECITGLDPVLFSAGLNHCVHVPSPRWFALREADGNEAQRRRQRQSVPFQLPLSSVLTRMRHLTGRGECAMTRCFWLVAAVFSAVVGGAWAQAPLPGQSATRSQPVVVLTTLALDGQTNCFLTANGTAQLLLGSFTGPVTNRVATAEIVRMEVAGQIEGLGEVLIRAGSNLVGRASLGSLSATNRFFPADSVLDVFLRVTLPSGTNLVNVVPIRLTNSVTAWPPVGQTYVSSESVPLALAGNTNVVVGSLPQFALTFATRGTSRMYGLSASVVGTNTVRLETASTCLASTGTAVVAGQRQFFSGEWRSQPGCDESFRTNLQFIALWNTTQRPGDWRGFHTGRFVLFHLDGGRTNLVGFGTMDGSNGVGTRQAPLALDAEDCVSCYRFEGRLRGRVIERGPLAGARLEGTYAGEYLDDDNNPVGCCPPPPQSPRGPFRMRVEGSVVQTCR